MEEKKTPKTLKEIHQLDINIKESKEETELIKEVSLPLTKLNQAYLEQFDSHGKLRKEEKFAPGPNTMGRKTQLS